VFLALLSLAGLGSCKGKGKGAVAIPTFHVQDLNASVVVVVVVVLVAFREHQARQPLIAFDSLLQSLETESDDYGSLEFAVIESACSWSTAD